MGMLTEAGAQEINLMPDLSVVTAYWARASPLLAREWGDCGATAGEGGSTALWVIMEDWGQKVERGGECC